MLTEKTMLELSDMLAGGTCSAVDIAKAYLERIETLNPRLNAFITVDPERTLREARESDDRRAKGQPLSRLDGIPVAIKDNICTEDLRTTCASGMLRDFVPTYNATSYRKMRAAGLVTLGKTNMDEFAMGSTSESSFFGPVRNPWNTDCVPGGSSGGSAVAVAARMAPVALGSDTGGSIRQPASFCGVVGIKPTYGRVSRFGLVAYASSLDQIGTFARTSADAAALLEVISGHDTGDSTSVDHGIDFGTLAPSIKGLKLGMPVEYFNGLPESIAAVIKQRIEGLKARGAEIIDISLKLTEYAIPAYYLIATAEASSNLARFDGIRYGFRAPDTTDLQSLYEMTRSEGFGAEVKRRIILGTFALSSGYYDAYYLQALKARTMIIEDFKQAFDKVDAIVAPVTTSTAFKIGEKTSDPLEMYLSDILTISCNLAGIPGLSVPAGTDANGMPIGLQILGHHFAEKTILELAKAVEEDYIPGSPEL